MKRDLDDLIRRMYNVVYPAMREEYTADCCIAAAFILKRVLSLYGYTAREVPVAVQIFNPEMVRLIKRAIKFPDDPRERLRLWELTNAWGVGIVPESAVLSGGRGYGGHLLVSVKDKLIDATLQQAQRPAKKIVLPPLISFTPDEGWHKHGVIDLDVGECVVRYQRIHDRSYMTAPDWRRRTTPVPETVRKIIERIEAQDAKPEENAAD